MGTGIGTERPVPRWADRVAHAIPLLMLPVCLWRLPFAFGHTMGLRMDGYLPDSPWVMVPYVFGLSVLSETVALLSFGLVRGWGEAVPGWVPLAGGRRLRPVVVLVPATLVSIGALALTADWILATFSLFGMEDGTFSGPGWLLAARVTSGLFNLWGPLLAALTWAYYVRRCRPAR
ncbi:hypothetical protein J7I97_29265 [Streptomyces sp. ISL-87]|nr:hypothetical protein [Streptomyces sp. ISL-21]MBT2612217.1 hypothetical protein [Streptomyces sp. ISL-87]